MNRVDILREAYLAYQKSPNIIGYWLYNEIMKEEGEIPILVPGEILFYFCAICGMDYLAEPEKCMCGSKNFEHLGTQQGIAWRNKQFSSGNFRCRTVVACSHCGSTRVARTTGQCSNCGHTLNHLPEQ